LQEPVQFRTLLWSDKSACRHIYYYICKSRQQYRYFDNFGDLKFVELPLSTLQISNGLSQYRQAKILNELILENKLIIKLGKGRKRYYTIIKEQTNENGR
jgi:hypothetical protein